MSGPFNRELIGNCFLDVARFRENCFSIRFIAGDDLPLSAGLQALLGRFLLVLRRFGEPARVVTPGRFSPADGLTKFRRSDTKSGRTPPAHRRVVRRRKAFGQPLCPQSVRTFS